MRPKGAPRRLPQGARRGAFRGARRNRRPRRCSESTRAQSERAGPQRAAGGGASIQRLTSIVSGSQNSASPSEMDNAGGGGGHTHTISSVNNIPAFVQMKVYEKD